MIQEVARLSSIRSVRLLSLAGVAMVVLLALAVYLLNSSSSAERSRQKSDTSGASPPEFLAAPALRSGPGWTLETRVSNLLALDLASAVEVDRYPGLRLSLIDVGSGQIAAIGTFGSNPFVRLRSKPAQLLVSDLDQETGQHRLLIFDLKDSDIVPSAEIKLPLRHGYNGFANVMQLSQDERYLFVEERSLANRPECQQPSFDGESCFNDLVGVIDLTTAQSVESAAVPGYCAGMALSPVGSEQVLVRCLSGGVFLVSVGGSRGGPLVEELVPPPSAPGEGSTLGPLEYATVLPDGSIRLLLRDGAVLKGAGEFLSPSLLPPDHAVIRAERIDDRSVLILAGARQDGQTPISEFVVLDLAAPKVERTIQAPLGTISVSALGGDRGVILLRSDQTYQVREINLATGQLSDLVALQGLPGEPDAIVR